MTESEWLEGTDVPRMLNFLRLGEGLTGLLKSLILPWGSRHHRDRTRIRKLRLFTCGCCRRRWHLLQDLRSREAVERAEAYADEDVASKGRAVAAASAWAAYKEAPEGAIKSAAWAAAACLHGAAAPLTVAWATIWSTGVAHGLDRSAYQSFATLHAALPPLPAAMLAAEFNTLSVLIRDLVGNPFRPATLKHAWRTATVLALAQAAYENRTMPAGTLEPDRLAVLADALEDAGCADDEVIGHLREPGPHVRGCWVVDLLLEKE